MHIEPDREPIVAADGAVVHPAGGSSQQKTVMILHGQKSPMAGGAKEGSLTGSFGVGAANDRRRSLHNQELKPFTLDVSALQADEPAQKIVMNER